MRSGWTMRLRARSRRWLAGLPGADGAGLSLAQSARTRNSGRRSTAGPLAGLLAWAALFAALGLLTGAAWSLLPSWLAVSFALTLH